MSREIRLHVAAEAELDDAVAWYNRRRAGLGQELQVSLSQLLTRIAATPLVFPKVYKQVREALMRRFPYAVYFAIQDDCIYVLAIFHSRRDPIEWKSRVEE